MAGNKADAACHMHKKKTISPVYKWQSPAGISLRQDITTGYPSASHLQRPCQTLILREHKEK